MKYAVLLVSALMLFSCSEESSEGEGVVAEIDETQELENIHAKVKQFSKHVVAGDFEAVGEMYTEDAKIFPSGLDIVEGREAVTDYWDQPSDYSISYHRVSPEEVKIWGDEAYDYGYYEGKSMDTLGNESAPWKGKYVIIWKKENDDWKIHLDIWNRIDQEN